MAHSRTRKHNRVAKKGLKAISKGYLVSKCDVHKFIATAVALSFLGFIKGVICGYILNNKIHNSYFEQ